MVGKDSSGANVWEVGMVCGVCWGRVVAVVVWGE